MKKNNNQKEITGILVFDETSQEGKISPLVKLIRQLNSTQSIIYALRHWGHISQGEIADLLSCSHQHIKTMEDKARAILTEEQFPWKKSSVKKEIIVLNIINNKGLMPLKKLTPIQAFIGALRLCLHKTQYEIAEIFGCSQARISIYEKKGIIALGQCEIAETWKKINIRSERSNRLPWSSEACRAQKERCNTFAFKQAVSERMKRFYQTPKGKIRKEKLSEEATERLKKWAKEPIHINKTEQRLHNLLIRWGFLYKYVGDSTIWIGLAIKSKCNSLPYMQGCRNPDFIHRFFPGIIELYGEHWHRKEKLENRGDNGQSRIDHYMTFGYHTLIIWEHEIKDALKDYELALNLYNKLSEFESKLREEFRSEFGVDFVISHHTFSNPV